MLAKISVTLIALVIALGGGVYLSERTTREFAGFEKLQIGSWVAYPSAGSIDADPYLRASSSRVGRIGLGSAEGLAFIAESDDKGDAMRSTCNYRLSGRTSSARAWTFRVVDDRLRPIATGNSIIATNSGNVVRKSDGSFELVISDTINTRNWLPMKGDGTLKFILTLYDTSIGSNIGIGEFVMPNIEKLGCISE